MLRLKYFGLLYPRSNYIQIFLSFILAGLPFWSELTQTSLNSDHSSYFGLTMGLNFPQKSDRKNIYSNIQDFGNDNVG